MSGINKVILVGRVGQDPEARALPNDGGSVTNLSLATSEQWRDKQTGEKREKTEWTRLVLFKRLAEIASEYVRKGSLIYVEGKLQTRKWTDNNGIERYATEVVVSQLQLLGSRNQEQSGPQPAQQPATDGQEDDWDQEIPF